MLGAGPEEDFLFRNIAGAQQSIFKYFKSEENTKI